MRRGDDELGQRNAVVAQPRPLPIAVDHRGVRSGRAIRDRSQALARLWSSAREWSSWCARRWSSSCSTVVGGGRRRRRWSTAWSRPPMVSATLSAPAVAGAAAGRWSRRTAPRPSAGRPRPGRGRAGGFRAAWSARLKAATVDHATRHRAASRRTTARRRRREHACWPACPGRDHFVHSVAAGSGGRPGQSSPHVSIAVILRACSGSTRESPSAVVNSTAGYSRAVDDVVVRRVRVQPAELFRHVGIAVLVGPQAWRSGTAGSGSCRAAAPRNARPAPDPAAA